LPLPDPGLCLPTYNPSIHPISPGKLLGTAKITYEGAFHHAMDRGINGDNIFVGSKNKTMFLDVIGKVRGQVIYLVMYFFAKSANLIFLFFRLTMSPIVSIMYKQN
jgi:hypothetical protein